MNREDFVFGFEVGDWELYLPVDSAWSNESRVKGIDLVCSHDHLDFSVGIEAVKLIEKLEHSSLNFFLPS